VDELAGKSSKKRQHAPRKRGRPATLPWLERVKWVEHSENARALARKAARMQEFDSRDQRGLARLPTELQLIVVLSYGRQSRYLDARALRLMAPPPRLDRLLRQKAAELIPGEPDRSRWTAEALRRFELVKKLRRAAFGKAANADAHLLMELIHIEQPARVGGGVAGGIDRWIAQHLGISLSAFWSWRRQHAEDLMLEKPSQPTPSRRSGQRMAHKGTHRRR
jgi:hypothetical protein